MSIVDELLPIVNAEVSAQNGTLDGSGAWTPTIDAPVVLPARVEVGPRTVMSPSSGQEVHSSGLVVLMGTLPHYDETRWRFTLPVAYRSPSGVPVTAIRIDPIEDETEVVAAEMYLP